jgi:hypothetical protein
MSARNIIGSATEILTQDRPFNNRRKTMVTDIFIDGGRDVSVQGTVVRLNLTVASATEKNAEGKPEREVRHRVIMTSHAATELHSLLAAALERLSESGAVKRAGGTSTQESEE